MHDYLLLLMLIGMALAILPWGLIIGVTGLFVQASGLLLFFSVMLIEKSHL